MIGSSIVFGLLIGSNRSSKIMNYFGRRKTLILGCVVGSIGCSLTIIFNLVTILLGRILFGIAVGFMTVTGSRFNEETIPSHLYEIYAPFNIIGYTIGVVISFSLGFILPSNDDIDALIEDKKWKIIYVYFPIGMFLVQFIGLMVFAKHDGIKYLIAK